MIDFFVSSNRRRNTKKNLFRLVKNVPKCSKKVKGTKLSEKGPSGLLDLTMVGHVVLILVEGGIAVILGKHGLEIGFGHGMPAVKVGTIVDTEVAEEIAE